MPSSEMAGQFQTCFSLGFLTPFTKAEAKILARPCNLASFIRVTVFVHNNVTSVSLVIKPAPFVSVKFLSTNLPHLKSGCVNPLKKLLEMYEKMVLAFHLMEKQIALFCF